MSITFGLFLNTGEFAGLSSHGEILGSAVAYAEAAERLGYHDVWVSEHHFIPFGVCSSALTMAGFLLGRTSRLRAGTAVTLAHLYHPLQLAEQVALLDQLSGGRLDFGIGRGGYLQEIEAFGVNRARHGLEVEATLDVLLSAWTDETVSSANPLFPFEPVALVPRPVTRPHPPLFVASSTAATVERAAREGLPLLLYWAMLDDQRARVLALYREAAERHGRDPDAVEHVIAVVGFVDDDGDAARAIVRDNLTWLFRAGDHPSVSTVAGRHGEVSREERAAIVAGTAAVGTPEQCVERLQTTIAHTGARRLTLLLECGADHARTLEQIERFARRVLPRVGATPAAPASVTLPAGD
jgi:alkanesulfonate monooxygenase SsuD/methylene tetrahydromethanopterin reductase-like flavin-dependent oxidoreductase (luciferase family)